MSKILVAIVGFAGIVAGAGWAAWPASDSEGGCCPLSVSVPRETGSCCEQPCEQAPSCCTQAPGETPVSTAAALNTVIAVEDMDCPSCAKKIVTKLKEVTGVEKVDADTKASKLTITPKDKAKLSAKAMWEAVEKAGFKPTKLEGPAGTFTAKPKE